MKKNCHLTTKITGLEKDMHILGRKMYTNNCDSTNIDEFEDHSNNRFLGDVSFVHPGE